MKCYEEIKPLFDEAKKFFDGKLTIKQDKVDQFSGVCSEIDKFVENFEAPYIDCTIMPDSGELIVSAECPDIVLRDGWEHLFCSIISKVSRFGFVKVPRKDEIRLDLVFGGFWDKVQ